MSRGLLLQRDSFSARAPRSSARIIGPRRTEWFNVGWICIAAAFGMSVLGVTAIATTAPSYATRQIAYLCVAMLAAGLAVVPHYRWLQRLNIVLMVGVLGLLVFVLLPFVPEAIVHPRNGARRWINLGLTDFQPSEVAKIAYIVALASYLRFRRNHRRLLGLVLPLLLTFIPMGLVLVEPDLGTAMLFLPTLFAMLIAAGAKMRHIVILVLVGVSAAPVLYPFLEPHQKARLNALYYQLKGDPRHVQGIGFQGDKAMTLVGAGGIAGVGREKSAALVEANSLPEEHNDMVFAVIACRWGMMGAALHAGLVLLAVLGGLVVAGQTKDPFGRLVAVGIVTMLFAQTAINVGMTIGVLPITGMTLPFVSYGGSSLVSAWLMMGILLSIGMRRPQHLAGEAFNFDDDDG